MGAAPLAGQARHARGLCGGDAVNAVSRPPGRSTDPCRLPSSVPASRDPRKGLFAHLAPVCFRCGGTRSQLRGAASRVPSLLERGHRVVLSLHGGVALERGLAGASGARDGGREPTGIRGAGPGGRDPVSTASPAKPLSSDTPLPECDNPQSLTPEPSNVPK